MKKRIINIIILIILSLFFIVGYYFIYKRFHIGIPCPFHKLTNLYCPGCGITRVLFYLFEGNIYKSFRSNQLVFILLPFIIFVIFEEIYSYITKKHTKLYSKIPNSIYIILLIISLVFGIIRNLPQFPFLHP